MFLLRWAFVLAILALVAGVLGYTGIAEGFAEVAQFLFFVFLGGVMILVILGIFVVSRIT